MRRHLKQVLWLDAIVFVVLFVFNWNLALVLPAPPRVEFWGLLWPPIWGSRYIVVPNEVECVSRLGVLVTFAILAGYVFVALGTKVKAGFSKARMEGGRSDP